MKKAKAGSKYVNEITPGEVLEVRKKLPMDFHWRHLRKQIPFLGEIFCVAQKKYYSALCSKKYRYKNADKSIAHLDEGHFQGYSFAIEEFTKPGDWVLDPFVGSGTAIIEAHHKGRNAVGIEIEYNELVELNLKHMMEGYPKKTRHNILIGDARDQIKKIRRKFPLVVMGFPYPIIAGGITSDKPMRPKGDPRGNQVYDHVDSFGNMKLPQFLDEMVSLFGDIITKTEVGGRIVTIIKDPINNKAPFMLQKKVVDAVLENHPGLEMESFFIHHHIPETLRIRSYRKRWPEVMIPVYQVGLVLRRTK
jgi:hypothetical protein